MQIKQMSIDICENQKLIKLNKYILIKQLKDNNSIYNVRVHQITNFF
jgi:hypothetical protein